jgi:hypothetical protein
MQFIVTVFFIWLAFQGLGTTGLLFWVSAIFLGFWGLLGLLLTLGLVVSLRNSALARRYLRRAMTPVSVAPGAEFTPALGRRWVPPSAASIDHHRGLLRVIDRKGEHIYDLSLIVNCQLLDRQSVSATTTYSGAGYAGLGVGALTFGRLGPTESSTTFRSSYHYWIELIYEDNLGLPKRLIIPFENKRQAAEDWLYLIEKCRSGHLSAIATA